MVDKDGMASAVVLRELHLALLRAAEGHVLVKPDSKIGDKPPVLVAQLFSSDPQAPVSWPGRVSAVVLSAGALVGPDAQVRA